MGIRQIALFGDSLSNDGYPVYSYEDGGLGGWPEIVADRLANIPGVGPLVSSGFKSVANGILGTPHGWTFTGSWTAVTASDAFDKVPYGFSQYANGASNIATFTVPPQWGHPVVGFAIYWVDYTSGGNWQYRVDGGTWLNMNQTLAHDNVLCKFYVPTAVTSTIEIRASSDATTGVGCLPAGMEVYYVDPTAANANGLIFHHMGLTAQDLHGLVAVGNDRLAILDSVRLGTGSPISPTPRAGVIMMHINDVKDLASTATWDTDVTTLHTRVAPFGQLLLMSPYETKPATYNATTQDGYRTHTKTTAAGFSPASPVLDLYDWFTALGYGTGVGTQNALLQSAGYIGDNIHETQLGHTTIAEPIFWFVRNNLFHIGGAGSPFKMASSSLASPTGLLGGQANAVLPDGKAVSIVAGSPTIHATNTITATGKAIQVLVGSPTTHGAKTITVSGVAVAVGAGSAVVHPGAVTITPTGKAVAVTAGGPIAIVGPNTIPAFGLAVQVSAGSPVITPAGVTRTVTGVAVVIVAGSPTLQNVLTIHPAGKAIQVVAGSPTSASHTTISVAGVPVVVGAGQAFILGGISEPVSASVTVVAHARASVAVLPGPRATVSV